MFQSQSPYPTPHASNQLNRNSKDISPNSRTLLSTTPNVSNFKTSRLNSKNPLEHTNPSLGYHGSLANNDNNFNTQIGSRTHRYSLERLSYSFWNNQSYDFSKKFQEKHLLSKKIDPPRVSYEGKIEKRDFEQGQPWGSLDPTVTKGEKDGPVMGSHHYTPSFKKLAVKESLRRQMESSNCPGGKGCLLGDVVGGSETDGRVWRVEGVRESGRAVDRLKSTEPQEKHKQSNPTHKNHHHHRNNPHHLRKSNHNSRSSPKLHHKRTKHHRANLKHHHGTTKDHSVHSTRSHSHPTKSHDVSEWHASPQSARRNFDDEVFDHEAEFLDDNYGHARGRSVQKKVLQGRNRRYLDGNSYLPVFEQTSYDGDVKEDAPIGTSILSVSSS